MSTSHEDVMASELQADLERHATFGSKVSGGPGDAATASWIADRLEALAFEVKRQPVPVPFFEARKVRLSTDDAQADLHAQPPYHPHETPCLTASLAVVRHVEDAPGSHGRIALVVLPHARHASLMSPLIAPLISAAEAAGALAVVIVPTGPTGNVVALNAPLEGAAFGVPLAVLAPVHAEPFLHAARVGGSATFALQGTLTQRTTDNLLGWRRRGPRWLCLSTPRTGWFTCTAERGTGTAALLSMAAWATRRFPELSIFVLNTGAHEFHFAGASRAMGAAPPPAQTVAWVHLGAALAARDHLEFRGLGEMLPSADTNRFTMVTDDLRAAAANAFAGLAGLERVRSPTEGVSELSTILRHGYPSAMAVLGMPRHFHTPEDDLRQVDGGLLAPVVRAHMQWVEAAVRAHAVDLRALP